MNKLYFLTVWQGKDCVDAMQIMGSPEDYVRDEESFSVLYPDCKFFYCGIDLPAEYILGFTFNQMMSIL